MLRRFASSSLSSAALAPALVALALGGCLVVVDYDPIGNDATIEAHWTIDGAPPTTASCAALGVDTVRIGFYDSVDPFYDRALEAPCADGVIAPPNRVLASGTYAVRVEAWRAGALVASGNMQTITVRLGDHAVLRPTNFTAGGFDPRGNDATVSGTWTVDGVAPSATSCAAIGVDTVRLAFYNGATPFYDTTLEAPCAAGGLDTRPTAVLRAGSYTVRFEAWRDGALVGSGAMTTITATAGGHVTVAPADFVSGAFDPRGTDATLTTGWTLNGRTPTASSCWAVGIDDVRVVLFAPTDVAYEAGIEVARAPCATGFIDTAPMPVIRAGTYLVSIELLDAADQLIGSYEPTDGAFTVTPGSELDIAGPDFVFPTTLTIGLDWIRPPGGVTGTPGTCAEAGVAQLSYTLTREGGGLTLDSGGRVACGEIVTFDSMDDGITAGTYNLYFEGYDASGAKHWAVTGSMCRGIVVDDGGLVAMQCVADYSVTGL